jgi:hypothetical protein
MRIHPHHLSFLAATLVVVNTAGCGATGDTPPIAMRVSVQGSPATQRVDGAVGASVPAATDSTTRLRFESAMKWATTDSIAQLGFGDIVQRIGERFVGTSYVGGLLDASEEEVLVVDLDEFDCVLFVESVLSMAQGVAAGDTTFDGFVARLERLRYRDGRLDGYCSRLHYFSEWIHDNEEKGLVHNVTLALGGLRAAGDLDFMSANRDLYARFVEDDSLYLGIRQMEASIASLDRWYIPQERIRSIYPLLQSGDIIAIATTVEGLDVSHSGFAYERPDGNVGLLHASTSSGVTIDDDLADYVIANRTTMGIVVARPADARMPYD